MSYVLEFPTKWTKVTHSRGVCGTFETSLSISIQISGHNGMMYALADIIITEVKHDLIS